MTRSCHDSVLMGELLLPDEKRRSEDPPMDVKSGPRDPDQPPVAESGKDRVAIQENPRDGPRDEEAHCEMKADPLGTKRNGDPVAAR